MTDKPKRKHSETIAQLYQREILAWPVRLALLSLYILLVPITALTWFADSGLTIGGGIIATAILVWNVGYMTRRITPFKYKHTFTTEIMIIIAQRFNRLLYSIASFVFIFPLASFLQKCWKYTTEVENINAKFIIIPAVMILIFASIMSYAVSFYINFLGQTKAKYDYFVNYENENVMQNNLSSIEKIKSDPHPT
jgi:hypothetical protein